MNPDSLPCLPEGALSGEETLCNNSVYREMDSFSELPDYVSTDIAVYDVVSDGITYFATHFYTCEWIVVKDGQGTIVNFFLAVGGEMCIIKILNCLKREVYSTLEGHAGIIKALRSFRNNSYLLLSGSTDGSIRLWDIRKATPLSVMTLFDGFSLLTSLDVSLCGTHFACTDCNGVVCIYTKKDDTFELEHTIYTGTGYRTLWVGELLLGVVNNVCTLYYPCVKTLNDSPTTVINVYRQYSMTTAPSSFCINNDASVLACLFHSTVKLFTIDTDSEPSVTFLIPEDRFLASPDT
ncbi:WD40-repeat protein [Blastocystis sp. ATCC 50177/Nand II]|uniref:WD40-repeat protein n=1 Tax=Blastocystis sp. subtype 1 (strain ATCC 50177 / NandII) TaxID=478820 RepID=A0A196SHB4_BLAHN|nr:WD40-repeat protein [Blastocystis sp. ATCC 50177/Nand II]